MTKKTMTRVPLGDIAEFINGGAWSQREYSTEGIPLVRVTNLKDGTVDLTDCKFLPSEALAKYSKHVLRSGDLIISTVGSHPSQPGSVVGRPCIAPHKLDGALLNQNAVLIRTSTEAVDQGWLGYLGRSKPFRDYVIGCARGSANQVRMAIGLLKEMPVTVPPLDLQKRVAAIRPYYLVPDGKVGHDAFAVIRETIRSMDKVAIGRVVLTSREHIIGLEPLEKGLMGTLLRYPYEVRDEKEYFDEIQDVKVTKDMLDLAKHIVNQRAADFDPTKFEDHYEEALTELINAKPMVRRLPPSRARGAITWWPSWKR